ncbi:MAG: PHP domain-containing protein [Lentisphaerae bacterium]|nr:PHP domain-containing protein [Lentisphaerota bacterium]
MIIDLHIHSTASDGTRTPSEILSLASGKNLGAVALTDHDTIAGIPKFLTESAKYPDIKAVPGVEISLKHYDYSIHVVGLFIDHKSDLLNDFLCEIRKNRDSRNEMIIAKLRKHGFDISLEEVNAEAGGESAGRPHFASILIRKGYFSEPQEAFDKCLKRGRPGYCDRILPSPAAAVDVIHKAGGIVIWAHPMSHVDADRRTLLKILKFLVGKGIDGIEAYYPSFTPEQNEYLLSLAEKHGLAVSGGSDFHGDNMKGIDMGTGSGTLAIPYSVYEKLEEFSVGKRNS